MTPGLDTTQAARGRKREPDQLAAEGAKAPKLMETAGVGGARSQGPQAPGYPPRFSLQNCATPIVRQPKRVPRASELAATPSVDNLPDSLAVKFAGAKALLAFDLETHDIIRENTSSWVTGQFGFPARVGPRTVDSLRAVQIGWAVGFTDDTRPASLSRVINPDGFTITPDAVSKHKISQSMAEESGESLSSALKGFLLSVKEWCGKGARLVAHQLEFDAGIISAELDRCGLGDLKEDWEEAVRNGICTMDPDIAVWLREVNCIRDHRDNKPISYNIPLGLKDATRLLVPDCQDLRQKHHAADKDATMAWLICRELVAKCKGSTA